MDIAKKHDLNGETKVVTLRKCWSLIFDVNSNAPANETVVSFATKELADNALALWRGQRDNDQDFCIVVGGQRHFDFPMSSVEGYKYDTYYQVVEDWKEDDEILTSLLDLTKLDSLVEDTDLPDGIHFNIKSEDDEEEDE